MKYWNLIGRIAAIVIIVFGLLAVLSLFLPKLSETRQLQRTKAAIEEENNRLANDVRQLESKRKRFNYDKAFVERTAREIGMVKPDETIYKFYPTNDER